MNKPFCVFIISHGRPDKVKTLRTLKRCGYTGPLFIVCDNEDEMIGQYRANYGPGTVLVFDKPYYASLIDSCDNFQNRRTTTHARNACFDLAKDRGFEYFIVMDDDYTDFRHTFNRAGDFVRARIINMDSIFRSCFRWIETDERILSLCFLQSGDFIGGSKCTTINRGFYPFKKRKAMNSFMCKTSRRFWFFSRLNEDVNTYTSIGARGDLFFSIPDISLNQSQSQKCAGGMTDAYLSSGTYVKSFYTAMTCPSSCKIEFSKDLNRLHHKIKWNNTVPKIINETYRKP